MTVSRDHILSEVRRTAAANGGKPLGRLAFFAQTGIREHDWRGRFWVRWNDVLKEAGFGPNALQEARPDNVLLGHFADLALDLGHLPVYSELRLKKRADVSFPNDKTFMRLGSKPELLAKLRTYCETDAKYSSLLPLIDADLQVPDAEGERKAETETIDGFVYLVKMGKHYKIGKTFSVPRRHRELSVELPEKLKPIHVIRTDDPSGIEAYWHKRFDAKRLNGEWFALAPGDVSIFKKRKFM